LEARIEVSDLYYLGIDPGATGGLCMLNPVGDLRMLVSWQDILETSWLQPNELPPWADCRAMLEMQQTVYIPLYKQRSNAKASFSLGVSYGRWIQWLVDREIKYHECRPREWQKGTLAGHDWQGKKVKDVSLQVARAMHPNTRITKALADCVNIAHYSLIWWKRNAE
jgi:NADH:ubiquinone oxidoreductase subunit